MLIMVHMWSKVLNRKANHILRVTVDGRPATPQEYEYMRNRGPRELPIPGFGLEHVGYL